MELISRTTYMKNRHKVHFKYHLKELIAIYWDDIDPIVYDAEYDQKLSKYIWSIDKYNKVITYGLNKYMHSMIFENSRTVSQINGIYRDNRLTNLTSFRELQTKQRQIVNDELNFAGIYELPKYMNFRFGYFSIIAHPIFKFYEKQYMNIDYNKNISLFENYINALSVLETLNKPIEDYKNKLRNEYIEIVRFVKN